LTYLDGFFTELDGAVYELFGLDVGELVRRLRDRAPDVPETEKGWTTMGLKAFKPFPLTFNYDRERPIGTVSLAATLLAPEGVHNLERMVLAPEGICDLETGRFKELTGFGMIEASTYDFKDGSVPVRVGDTTVGMVRISEPMVFQVGRLKDLDLEPEMDGEGDVVGYRVIDVTMDPARKLADALAEEAGSDGLEPGTYIFDYDPGAPLKLERIPRRHILELDEGGFSLQHPYECRAGGKSLHDCEMWETVQAKRDALEDSDAEGRFYVEYDEDLDKLWLEPADSKIVWGVRRADEEVAPVEVAADRRAAMAACREGDTVVYRQDGTEWREAFPDA
jgi:hypothetical protein